jgi:hypothetical protein
MALDNITFVDLVALMRITPDATVERFGGLINSSFFDASNILGTLKQKGLVDFITQFPSQSALNVTDQGKQLIAEVQQRSSQPFDTLDMAILTQLANGKRNLSDLNGSVNVTSKDLAIHLYKLSVQQFMSYELRNGSMSLTMTEKGFLCVKEGMPRPEQPAQAAQTAQPSPLIPETEETTIVTPGPGPMSSTTTVSTAQTQQPGIPRNEQELKALDAKISAEKKMKGIVMLAIIVIIIVVLGLLYVTHLI